MGTTEIILLLHTIATLSIVACGHFVQIKPKSAAILVSLQILTTLVSLGAL